MCNILEVKNVDKKFAKFSLKNVSFEVPQGAIVGFIGRNGAGKTTTLKGIMNLQHFDSGEVLAFNKNFKDNELEIKQNIGFSLSELSYYPNKSIKQMMNVTKRFYKNFDEERYARLCKLFNLDENKKLQELSSGMKVKYSLAIALSYNAKLLILDEPTSGLDPISRDEVLDIFSSIIKNKDRGILFSTHITSDLDKCASHIVYIHEGSIVYNGSKENFIKSYYLIETKDLSEEVKTKLISFKNKNGSYEGLINKDDYDFVKDFKDIKIKEPNLEEIMIYLERGKNNEEFAL